MFKSKILFFFVLCFLAQSCMDKRKEIQSIPLDLKIITCDKLTNDDVKQELINIITPLRSQNCDTTIAYAAYDGKIHFQRFGIDNSSQSIEIIGEEPWYDFHIFGEPAIDKKIENITENYFKNAKISEALLKPNTISNEDVIFNLKKYLSENKEAKQFIFSKDMTENNYDGIKVYHSIDSLKNAIALNACQNKTSKFIVICKLPNFSQPILPTSQVGKPNSTVVDKSQFEEIRTALLSITQKSNPIERRNLASKIFRDKFTANVNFKIYKDNINSMPTDYGDYDGSGFIFYMKKLRSDDSILDLNIVKIERSTTDGKISYLELIEIHKQ